MVEKECVSKREYFLPHEDMLEILENSRKFRTGVLSGQAAAEYRVPLTPESAGLLGSFGHTVHIESGAGMAANYSDDEYRKAGAVVTTRADVLTCDVVLSLPPLSEQETSLMSGQQTVFTEFILPDFSAATIRQMMSKKITAVAYELLEDDSGSKPIVDLTSQMAGITAVSVAAEYLSKSRNGKGTLLGGVTGISPTEVLVIGATPVAEYVARAAGGMGAHVRIFDNNVLRLHNIETRLGRPTSTSVLHPAALSKAMRSADVVIATTAESIPNRFLAPKELVQRMKKGAVIIDLDVIHGGCFETSRRTTLQQPAYETFGVIHYCVPNITALVARTASIAMSNVIAPLIIGIGETGGILPYLKATKGFRKGVYLYNGVLTRLSLGSQLNLPVTAIDLLLDVL
ncbi:MAG: alanine dehydrogenase [Bacteroidales bacterium]|jgi:alanine dehydrogenase|nr:alanine dehydrogenase [Bacteroidales bacterium]